MLKASEITERDGYVSFEGSTVKAQEFLEPSGVSAFGLESEYPHVADTPENVAFRILPGGQAVADEFEESNIDKISVYPESTSYTVGQTYEVDFKQAMCVYDAGSEQGWGRYLFAEVEDSIQTAIVNDGVYTSTGLGIGTGYSNYDSIRTIFSSNIGNAVREATKWYQHEWFIPSLDELQTGLDVLGQRGDKFYFSSSKGGISLWGVSATSVTMNTLNSEGYIKLFTTDKLINSKYKIGQTIRVNETDVTCVYDSGRDNAWGRYLFIDTHGIGYYDKGIEDSWDSSTTDYSSSYPFGASDLVNLPIDIGTGKSNSDTAVTTLSSVEGTIWNKLAELRTVRSNQNWFVPSAQELFLVFVKRFRSGNYPSGGQNAWLWSSSVGTDSTLAYNVTFYDGPTSQNNKNNPCHCHLAITDTGFTGSDVIDVGDTIEVDGIPTVVIYKADTEQNWGRYVCVDKNHDLTYYILGTDLVDSATPSDPDNTYGWEWGGYGTATGITDTSIGAGLSNTNSLISLGLQPETEGWPVIWNQVSKMRESYSNRWFVPSHEEALLIYSQINQLTNVSRTTQYYYFTSSEKSGTHALGYKLNNGVSSDGSKNGHGRRTRLCCYLSDSDLTPIS